MSDNNIMSVMITSNVLTHLFIIIHPINYNMLNNNNNLYRRPDLLEVKEM